MRFIIDTFRYSWAAISFVVILSSIVHTYTLHKDNDLRASDKWTLFLVLFYFIPVLLTMIFLIPLYQYL